MKYRKKPVVIDAEQWFPGNHCRGVMGDNPNKLCGCLMIDCPDQPHIHTIHDNQIVLIEPGDFIVPELDGIHYYPIKPDISAATYELIEE